MVKAISGIFRGIMFLVTIFTCVLYLVICLVPYIDTGKYWYVSMLGLGFPLILAFLLMLLVFWMILRSKRWILCLVVLLLGFQQIRAAISFHFPGTFQIEKADRDLRIMQWNVHNWNQIWFDNEMKFSGNTQIDMMNLISKYDPDILCTEEFFESIDSTKGPSSSKELTRRGYPYHYFLHGDMYDGYFYAGIAIFSKYPITKSGYLVVNKKDPTVPIAFADINVNGRMIKVFAVHLQSVKFKDNDYSQLRRLKTANDPSLTASKSIVSKLRNGFRKRYDQSIALNQHIKESPYPVVVCGDFNDVPNSGVYFNVRKNLQDAFLKQGSFIGRTFRFISPTLRIDYIMPSDSFVVNQFKVIRASYSDHYPLITDLGFK